MSGKKELDEWEEGVGSEMAAIFLTSFFFIFLLGPFEGKVETR